MSIDNAADESKFRRYADELELYLQGIRSKNQQLEIDLKNRDARIAELLEITSKDAAQIVLLDSRNKNQSETIHELRMRNTELKQQHSEAFDMARKFQDELNRATGNGWDCLPVAYCIQCAEDDPKVHSLSFDKAALGKIITRYGGKVRGLYLIPPKPGTGE